MARVLYRDNADSSTGTATQLDAVQAAGTDEDRVLLKIIVGKPVAGASITVFENNNAFNAATTNIAFKYTYPTFAAGTPASDTFDFTSPIGPGGSQTGVNGLILKGGGSVYTTSAMQVSFIYTDPDA